MSANTLNTLKLRVVEPSGAVVEKDVVSVRIPGESGSFGVLPRHAPLVALTGSGLLTARGVDGSTVEFLIHDGFAEVRDNVVTVLTRSAEDPAQIDFERAAKAAERARERLNQQDPELDEERAHQALRRALVREKVARRRV